MANRISKTHFDPAECTAMRKFKGTLQKIKLVSNNICLGPIPMPNDEIEQRLTISADGRVWLSRYSLNAKQIEKSCFSISSKSVKTIMKKVSAYFKNGAHNSFVTDVGTWDLILTKKEKLSGLKAPCGFLGVRFTMSCPM